MLIDVHLRRPDGSPGRLYDTIEREFQYKSSVATNWVTFDGEDYPVLTGVRPFIVIPEDRTKHVRQIKKGVKS